MKEKEFEKKQREILAAIPEEFHSYFSYLAWERGHSCGLDEVILCLDNLITDNFKLALGKYSDRLAREERENF